MVLAGAYSFDGNLLQADNATRRGITAGATPLFVYAAVVHDLADLIRAMATYLTACASVFSALAQLAAALILPFVVVYIVEKYPAEIRERMTRLTSLGAGGLGFGPADIEKMSTQAKVAQAAEEERRQQIQALAELLAARAGRLRAGG